MKKIRVGMSEADISTNEIPVIGTDSLGPCVGVLIHSKKHKKSVVLHASTEWKEPVITYPTTKDGELKREKQGAY